MKLTIRMPLCTVVRHIFCIFVIWSGISDTKGQKHGNDEKRAIRLVGADNPYSGRVEVFLNDTWSTVCNVYWDIRDSHVACKMAGFQDAQATYVNAVFGKGSGEILLSHVKCTGEEDSLFDCKHSRYSAQACSHDEDVAVVCITGHKDNSHIGRNVVIVIAVVVILLIAAFVQQHRRLSRSKRRHVTCQETMEFICITLSSCGMCSKKCCQRMCPKKCAQRRMCKKKCGGGMCTKKCGGGICTKKEPETTLTNGNVASTSTTDNASNRDKTKTEKEPKAKFSYAKFSNEGDEEQYEPSPISHDSISSPRTNSTVASVHGVPKPDASVHGTVSQNGSIDNAPHSLIVDGVIRTGANLDSRSSKDAPTVEKPVKIEPILDSSAKTEADSTAIIGDTFKSAPATEASLPTSSDINGGMSNAAYEPDANPDIV